MRNMPSKELAGIGLSAGVAIGTAYRVEPKGPAFYRLHIPAADVPAELLRLRKALGRSKEQLSRIKRRFVEQIGQEHANVIDAHLLILEDRQFVDRVEEKIRNLQESPERAVREVAEDWLAVYRSLQDPFFRERGSDLDEVADRVIANLTELDVRREEALPEDLILVATEISLSNLSDYPLAKVKGLLSTRGSRTSHVTIISRFYQIPVVSGIDGLEQLIRTGDAVILDGTEGVAYLHPSPSEKHDFEVRRETERRQTLVLKGDTSPCVTSDGRGMSVYANTEMDSEVPTALRLGAEGIGLFRSEFIHLMSKEDAADEEEQFLIYKNLAETTGDRPALVRTLDMGGGRQGSGSPISGDDFLGLRGIRLSLKHPDVFKIQVRAILRARSYGNLKILLPMVSSVDELIEGKELIREVEAELSVGASNSEEPVEVGIMIEVPSALLTLEDLCVHTDLLAVGTNDLIQYTLAADRSSEEMSYLFNPLHPAILKSLERIARVAGTQGRTTLVCGEIASHPLYAYLLIGMGFQHLSMNPFSIPELKKAVRNISYLEARQTVDRLLKLSTIKEVEAFVDVRMKHLQPLVPGPTATLLQG